jgi:geranylgeranyl pyrophosphate synthase
VTGGAASGEPSSGGSSVSIGEFLAGELPRIDAALDRAMDRLPAGTPAAAAIRHGVLSGGKRLRPILLVEAFRSVRGEAPEAAYDLGAAVELIHAYSLMHDDLPCMDDALLRRGEPTTHREHGEDDTMLGGAALIPLAGLQSWNASGDLGCADVIRRQLLVDLCRAAGSEGMVGGQVLDLLGEDEVLTAEELDGLHSRKTGALLTAPLVMGARAAGAGPDVLEAMTLYGRSIGLAFQVADDILDATSSAEELGKNPSDEDLNKSTYVSLHGLAAARDQAGALVEEGLEALRRGGVDSEPLRALAHFIVERDH